MKNKLEALTSPLAILSGTLSPEIHHQSNITDKNTARLATSKYPFYSNFKYRKLVSIK